MRLQDVMTTPVETIDEHESAVFANELMWRKQCHHLVVTSQGKTDRIVGILSDTDLGGAEANTIPDNLKVKDCMSSDVVAARPDTTIKDAINLMRGHQIHCLPVLDDTEHLLGIVTLTDIERLEKRGKAQPPFQGLPSLGVGDYVQLENRNRRGAKSKHGHSEWPHSI